jgi:hypothetical protein
MGSGSFCSRRPQTEIRSRKSAQKAEAREHEESRSYEKEYEEEQL